MLIYKIEKGVKTPFALTKKHHEKVIVLKRR
jgi:hypothetical protein